MEPHDPSRIPTRRWPALATTLLAACGAPMWKEPIPIDQVDFRSHAATLTEGELTVTVAIPGREETKALFGTSLYADHIQPVWVEVDNRGADAWLLIQVGIDPELYSPLEASYQRHSGSEETRLEMDRFFSSMAFHGPVQPHSVTSGFVFTNLDHGFKAVSIDLVSEQQLKSLSFVVPVPGIVTDTSQVDYDALYEEVTELEDEAELRAVLESLPRCTTNAKGTRHGDPLNVVMVGDRGEIFAALIRRGWQMTEVVHAGSAFKTMGSFLFGSRYRYSPMSALYVFGRSQDIGLQKARGSIHQRNHMRMWRTPYDYRGMEVYLGQISRDIGVKLHWPTITTHVIDPDVDDTRDGLLGDLAYSQGLSQFGFVEGSQASSVEDPHQNLGGDPYYSDGLRVVMFFEEGSFSLTEIGTLDWATHPTSDSMR